MEQTTVTVAQWTCEEVYEWATEKVGEKSAFVLKQEEIDGMALLAQTETSLRAYGIAGGPATKLCVAVKVLVETQQQQEKMYMDIDYRTKLDTCEQLKALWAHIGTSEEERHDYLNDLSHRVQALYHSRVQEQSEMRESYEEKVRSLQLCIGQMCDQLQVESPEAGSSALPLLQQIAFLTGQIEVLKQERERQYTRNSRALNELELLYEVLGENMPDTQYLQLGAHRLAEIQGLIGETHQKIADKKVLLETAKAKVYAELQDLMLQDDEYTELDRLVLLDGADIPLAALGELARRGVELEEINQDRKERLKALARKIAAIWNILNIPTEHRKEFMGGNAGLGRATFEKCEKELAELEAQKRIQLPCLLEGCEQKLRLLWAETCTSQLDQNNFFESYLEMNNELKFTAIKQQILEVEEKLHHMQPLLAFVTKREQIKQDEDTYTALQSDPNRFKIAGLPLRLEQMRKNFQSFPKLAARMKQEIEAWEAINGPFLRNGERLLATMEANGELDEGYVPGFAELRRNTVSKAEAALATPHKSVRSTTIPRSRVTPSKQDGKFSSHSLPAALTPNKKEVVNSFQSARKRVPPPTTRKSERENRVERNENHGKATADATTKQREKPMNEQQATPNKRLRTPLKESNY